MNGCISDRRKICDFGHTDESPVSDVFAAIMRGFDERYATFLKRCAEAAGSILVHGQFQIGFEKSNGAIVGLHYLT